MRWTILALPLVLVACADPPPTVAAGSCAYHNGDGHGWGNVGGIKHMDNGAINYENGSYRQFVCRDGKLYWADNGQLVHTGWATANQQHPTVNAVK